MSWDRECDHPALRDIDMSFVELIARKRDGGKLGRSQIAEFVRGAADGTVPPEQLAALLMAICCRGMDDDETRWLTEAMLFSGEVWSIGSVRPDVVDKHSTGGVADTVSLILAPLLAAVGVPVAMMAGRGLAHSQGTLDKVEAIPGFDSRRDRGGLLQLLDTCGAAIVAQTETIAPADRSLYALRDVTGTVPSLPLIVASIMSKKLAMGAACLVLDVKWGSGAFRKTVAQAHELGLSLRAVARSMGMACEALVTDMNQPLGSAVGTACEVLAAREVLENRGDPLLREVTVRLCQQVMALRGFDVEDSRSALLAALEDGAALAAWERLVQAHGGDPEPDRMARPEDSREVRARDEGVVAVIDAEMLGWLATDLGAGRRRRDEPLDHAAGVLIHARVGSRVERGQPLATILLGRRPVDLDDACDRARAAFTIGGEEVEPPPLVLGTVDEALEPSSVR